MCGIAGILGRHETSRELSSISRVMADKLHHRGPDDSGVWTDDKAGIALAHRRLAILDLSDAGHQPMVSASGRFVIAFNGEIYNYQSMRAELDRFGHQGWRGQSDTEVLLGVIEHWGLGDALQRAVGMFSFALWDRDERVLHLARDRLGEKPLYYGLFGGVFLFGSELKALRAFPRFRAEVDRDALTLLLRHNYIPAPYSVYRGVFKLLPGTLLNVAAADIESAHIATPVAYWSARGVAEQGQRHSLSSDDDRAVQKLEHLLHDSIADQMIADVPLGAFLSGGIDSSTVAALMQAQSNDPVKTFSIGFPEEGYNEAEHANAVARHIGTEHTELYVTPEQAMALIPRLPVLYDEPFADSSQIPTFLVSQLTRQSVTVALSGDGGDELFGGYNRYFWATRVWRKIGFIPGPLRRALAGVLTALPPPVWNAILKRLAFLLPQDWRYRNPGYKLHKLADILAVRTPEEIYWSLVSHWKHPTDVVRSASEPDTVLTDETRWAALPNLEHCMMYLDLVSYLPDDILVKVDRAAMGVGLETRIPMLDYRVVEFAWRLPLSMKIRNGQGKWILRQILYKHVPKELIERPKMGFGIPIDSWLRGPIRDWAEALLDERRLDEEGYFNSQPIRDKWKEHLAGRQNWSYYLWDVLMFQAWLEAGS